MGFAFGIDVEIMNTHGSSLVESMIPKFAGRVVTANDADYDDVRKVWNGAIDHRPKLTHLMGARLFLMNNLQFIKVAAFAAFVLAIVLIPVDWMRKADYQKRVERFAHIARLANAVEIPGRDPSLDAQKYARELVTLFDRATRKE